MDKFIGKWAFPQDGSLLEQSARRGEKLDFDTISKDILEKLQVEKEDVVLDVCCGNAALTRRIAPHCKLIHGVDFSEEMIRSGESVVRDAGLFNVQLKLMDALMIDDFFSADTFDKSYCYFSFQYFNARKRLMLLEKLSKVTHRKGWIFIGDVPDRTRMWNFYKTPKQFYREKIARMIKFKEGECDLGWWVHPQEIIDWCESRRLGVSVLKQNEELPHSHYRFDVLIRNSKS